MCSSDLLNSMSSHVVSLEQGQTVLERMLQCSGKIHLVAERHVIESTVALVNKLVSAFNDLSRLKSQSEDLIREINGKLPAIQEGKRMIFHPQPGAPARPIAEVVIQLEKENTEAARQVDSYAWQMIDLWTERYSEMAPSVSQAVLAVKKELRIIVDQAWYTEMTKTMFAADTRCRKERLSMIRPGQSPET